MSNIKLSLSKSSLSFLLPEDILNPFDLFNIEPTFTLDLKALDRTYFELQKKYHPDRLSKKEIPPSNNDSPPVPTPTSSDINAAYHILKNPIKRAESLLEILNIPIPGKNGESTGMETMLLDILDFQETIMMCEDHEQAADIKDELEEHFNEELHDFAEHFDRGAFEELPDIYVKMSYLDRLRKQVTEVEQQLFKRNTPMH